MKYIAEFRCDKCKTASFIETDVLSKVKAIWIHQDGKPGVGFFRCGVFRFVKYWIPLDLQILEGKIGEKKE